MNFSLNQLCFLILPILTLITNINAANDNQQDANCLLPMEPGPCRMSLNRFYYNAQTDTCIEFKFGGCMGNDNKFGFKETCEKACKKTVAPTATSTTTATSFTKDTTDLKPKQLNIETLKSLTSATDKITSTTPRPKTTLRTTVKSASTTTKSKTTTTTQKI